MSPRYLVRFDDICPTMNWSVWHAVEEILVEADVKPILAVIPDNQDVSLKVAPPEGAFWDRIRAWQARGWTIGLHGYQHRYVTADPGMVGLFKFSEFAGLPREVQSSKLEMAFQIFRREAIRPQVWVAPGHSFDRTTVELLREMGLPTISDGFFLYPNLDADGTFWIPLQLWRFRRLPMGVWTVCLHINEWDLGDVPRFRDEIERYRGSITSLQQVKAHYADRRRTWTDDAFQLAYRQYLRNRSYTLSSPAAEKTPSRPPGAADFERAA